MNNTLSKSQESILNNFEKHIEAGHRIVPLFCEEHKTTPRNLSYLLSIVHKTTLQDFLSEYSNYLCGRVGCINFTKYKVTGHKYDAFCSTECRYKASHSNYHKTLTLDEQTLLIKEMIIRVQASKKLSPLEKRYFLESTDMEFEEMKKVYSNLKQSIKKKL